MCKGKLPCEKRMFATLLFLMMVGRLAFADSPQPRTVLDDKSSPAEIKELIKQLGSSNFSERENASKRLKEIGEPALNDLRKAAAETKDPEVRGRAERVIFAILDAALDEVFKKGIRLAQEKKDYKNAAIELEKAVKLAEERFWPDKNKVDDEKPVLSNVLLELARIYKELNDFEKAANSFYFAEYHSSHNKARCNEIHREWAAMIDNILVDWDKEVRAKISKNPMSKKLTDNYSLVLLHSRRYGVSYYLKSAFSFVHETSNEKQHENDVQLLFDNERVHQNNFQIRMVTNQRNEIIDLGNVDFEKESDAKKLAEQTKKPWETRSSKAVEDHVYLERVRDDRGNDFFVLFKIVAVDKDSRYMAFVWRRLPLSE